METENNSVQWSSRPFIVTAEGRDVLLLRKLLEQQTIAVRAHLEEASDKTRQLLSEAMEICVGVMAADGRRTGRRGTRPRPAL